MTGAGRTVTRTILPEKLAVVVVAVTWDAGGRVSHEESVGPTGIEE